MTIDDAGDRIRSVFDPKITVGNLINLAVLLIGMVIAWQSLAGEVEQNSEFRRQQPLVDRRQDDAIGAVDRRYSDAVASLSREIAQARLDSADIKGSIRAIERDLAALLRELEATRKRAARSTP